MKHNMFNSARIKLTAWYLLIIMLISIFFSMVIYTQINNELLRIEHGQQQRRLRFQQTFPDYPVPSNFPGFDSQEISDARDRLFLTLIFINMCILFVSGLAGYFLAGLTLKPIKLMIDDQNRFIADASHELRTPLTALRSEIEVNLRDKNLTIPQAKKLLESNLEETMHIQQLSDNLIKLTSSDNANAVPLDKLSLQSLIDDAIKKVRPMAKQKRITVHNKTTQIMFEGDKFNLVELFVILLDNAIKYSHTDTEVIVVSKEFPNAFQVEVVDQGVGIDKKDVPHIFDRFYRVDKARSKTETGGYGLGLSIAKNIVDSYHGKLNVKSKVDEGTTFIVELPFEISEE